jgi:hypothetical protein
MKVGVWERGGSGAGVGSTAHRVPTRNTWALDGGCGGALGNRMILGASHGVLGVPTGGIWGVPLLEISSPGRRIMEGLLGLTVTGEAARKVVWPCGVCEPGTWTTLGEVWLKFVRLSCAHDNNVLALMLSPS